jgi:hypothetical protein
VPFDIVREAAKVVATQLDLEPEWFNDRAKGFASGNNPAQERVLEGQLLSVAVASPRYLLAMKLLASRTDRDIDDIKTLYQLCGFSTAEEGVELLESFYVTRVLPPRARLLLEELFPRERSNDRGNGLGLERLRSPSVLSQWLLSVESKTRIHYVDLDRMSYKIPIILDAT